MDKMKAFEVLVEHGIHVARSKYVDSVGGWALARTIERATNFILVGSNSDTRIESDRALLVCQ